MKTALYEEHLRLGAKMVDFHGWEMPIQYGAGILEEHKAVRKSAGIFDVSHMGQIVVEGKEACRKLQTLYTNDIAGLEPGDAVYTHILREDGSIIDDTIVYRLTEDAYLAIPNASMIDVIFDWMTKHIPEGVSNLSDELACLAVQGPNSEKVMMDVFGQSINELKRFSFMSYDLDSQSNYTIHMRESLNSYTGSNEIVEKIKDTAAIFVARTGYTGENGYEIIAHNDAALSVWKRILAAGSSYEILPVGLGARDTLRLEMGYLLSGQDFDGSQTPLESASSWVVKWDHDFIGRDALLAQKESKDYDRLVGILLEKRLAARPGAPVFPSADTESDSPVETKGSPTSASERSARHQQVDIGPQTSEPIGTVTSGGFAPTVGKAIALARVKKPFAKKGTILELEVRGRRLKGTVVRPPFIKK